MPVSLLPLTTIVLGSIFFFFFFPPNSSCNGLQYKSKSLSLSDTEPPGVVRLLKALRAGDGDASHESKCRKSNPRSFFPSGPTAVSARLSVGKPVPNHSTSKPSFFFFPFSGPRYGWGERETVISFCAMGCRGSRGHQRGDGARFG